MEHTHVRSALGNTLVGNFLHPSCIALLYLDTPGGEYDTEIPIQYISCTVGLRIILKKNKISQLILSRSACGNMFPQHLGRFPVHETEHM